MINVLVLKWLITQDRSHENILDCTV